MTKKIIFMTFLLGVFFTSCNNQKKNTEETLFISSDTKPCEAGVRKMDCMQVKLDKNQKEWENFYDEIEGFTYEKGYEYEIIISKENVENPPADASSLKYKLVKLVSKTKVSPANTSIKDCPEEKIVDKMPMVSDKPNEKTANEYYIYKGQRKEISDFDSSWIKENCPQIKITEVH